MPGGRTVLHFRSELAGAPRCKRCGRRLHGIPRRWVRNRSGRTVSRPYAGVLCGGCLRELLKTRAEGLLQKA
ncbi:MAG: 50S ribosomal protein L34e [Nitrososphaerota archaeon]